MERDDIIGGLKSALARGESMNHAIATFVNAGYKSEDVEAAAKLSKQQPQKIQPIQQIQKSSKITHQQKRPMPVVRPSRQAVQTQNIPTVQRVSSYEKPKSKLGLVIVITLSAILLMLISILVGVIFFREDMARVLNGILGNA